MRESFTPTVGSGSYAANVSSPENRLVIEDSPGGEATSHWATFVSDHQCHGSRLLEPFAQCLSRRRVNPSGNRLSLPECLCLSPQQC